MGEIEKRLQDRDIKPTAIRLLVLKAMLEFPQAFSLADLEEKLDTVDKSTISRTIHLFHEKRLIHSIDDGSGSVKYSACSKSCMCDMDDMHVHFHCNKCDKTYCLESIPVPEVMLPDNFSVDSANFVLKGICGDCRKFAT